MYIYIYNLVFPQFLKIWSSDFNQILHATTTPQGASRDSTRCNSDKEIFFNGPPNFHPKFWSPLSPEGEQIFARSLRQKLGDQTPYKFGLSKNFRTDTLKGSNLRGKNLKFQKIPLSRKIYFRFPQFFRGCKGVFRRITVHRIDDGLIQGFLKFNFEKIFLGGPYPQTGSEIGGSGRGIL